MSQYLPPEKTEGHCKPGAGKTALKEAEHKLRAVGLPVGLIFLYKPLWDVTFTS